MITYRDRTFCAQSECAKFDDCPTAATDKIKEGAATHLLPLSLIKYQDCFEPKNIVKTDNGEQN